MVVQVQDKRVINESEIDSEFDGEWVLFIKDGQGGGQILAYGTEGVKDSEGLRRLNFDKFDGSCFVLHGYAQRGDEHLSDL